MLFFFKQKTAYEMRISDWSSDVCSSDLDLALVGLDFAGQQLEQGRLARAVRADDADAVAALDAEIQPLDDREVAEALGHALGHDHRLRSDIVVGEAELGDPGAAAHRGTGGAHFLQFLEPALVALAARSEEHTSELQSLMSISYAVFCWKKTKYQLKTKMK